MAWAAQSNSNSKLFYLANSINTLLCGPVDGSVADKFADLTCTTSIVLEVGLEDL